MPRKTKRQLQVNKILRKKGCYISRETEIETVEGEKWMDNKNINKWAEGEIVEDQIEDEINNDLTKDLKEFEKVEKKLITEVLCWHEKATSSIRTAYNKTLRTTIWRNTKKKEELARDAKGMRTLDTLFRSTEKSINMPLPQSLKPQSLSPSPFLSFETTSNSSLISKEITRNLQIRLDEINQQCTVTKNSKGDYIARCIRKWGDHFIKTEEFLIHHQGKHTKLESLLNDEDFKEEYQAWL
ncbi:uncharacterized protein OCT59_022890 [Rhizophagus irregularis]|uniref:Uncharacterized protein n=1 Tax=Rhizophagus irregularis (strain DAOM 197198w) TaxID=1432141 RepID=A0A015IFI9_RHIIW|nr:hypothetical protein RirG_250440 [Rhizophagus irregularis DAOM 197198w]UZO29413.1 hypothetical protein OCT59_022890 [Rhizophagus irregularis]CAG8716584.1 21857_t:CDS:2 [Rhizophagus irregularis]